MVFSHTAFTASGRPLSPSQTTMHTSLVPRFLISDRTRIQYFAPFPVAVLPGPQAQHVALAVHGDAQRQVDGPVRDLALADLHVNGIDEHDGINGIREAGSAIPPFLP